MKQFYGMAAAVSLLAASAAAQDDAAQLKAKAEMEALMSQAKVMAIGGRMKAKTVTGAPYSGQEISESNQTLADGTRIHNETRTTVYRDSEGRVRRESGD